MPRGIPKNKPRPSKEEMLARFGPNLRSSLLTPENAPARTAPARASRHLIYRALFNAATEKNCVALAEGAKALMKRVRAGDLEAWHFVAERLDGKIKQVVEHEGGNPQIAFVIATAEDLRSKIRGLPVAELAPPPTPPVDDGEEPPQT